MVNHYKGIDDSALNRVTLALALARKGNGIKAIRKACRIDITITDQGIIPAPRLPRRLYIASTYSLVLG